MGPSENVQKERDFVSAPVCLCRRANFPAYPEGIANPEDPVRQPRRSMEPPHRPLLIQLPRAKDPGRHLFGICCIGCNSREIIRVSQPSNPRRPILSPRPQPDHVTSSCGSSQGDSMKNSTVHGLLPGLKHSTEFSTQISALHSHHHPAERALASHPVPATSETID